MTNCGFSSNPDRNWRRLDSAVANGRPATFTPRNSGWVIDPSGATTKSPLNSGFLHTTIRTESPGVRTPAWSARAGRSWATAGVENAKERTSRARQARVRINPTE